ncbi:amidohydrolase [Merdimmobilis hominis]|uniref:amidohydrolase n=1 Tax=Merdimmobilis hominis TaxID=2897707 RepID=UPI0006C7DEEF|nr:amidohydrolase [Merdimmobilis hominis]PWL57454.1 MAG: amidohydrolase [Oscillospiraceae bacterium]
MLGQTAYKTIEANHDMLKKIALDMWANPEGPYREFKACEWISEALKKAGFDVEIGAGGVPTAIKATYGSGHPVIGFLGELDALPGLSQELCTEKKPIEGQTYGQGCGHNLLGVAHLGAVIGLKEEMIEKNLPGTIVYYGCPAEEQLTGKSFMARGGAFDCLDLAIHFHPGKTNTVSLGTSNALNSAKFHFKGRTAHAGGDPHNGRSALDAVELMNVGANYLREHVTSDVRIHYIITEGGTAPNIVPDKASNFYFIRAQSREVVEDTYERLCKIAQGAAMMTETELEIEYLGGCYNTLPNKVLGKVVYDCLKEVPVEPWTEEELKFADALNKTMPEVYAKNVAASGAPEGTILFEGVEEPKAVNSFGSTDVGDVQHICPAIMFNTATYNIGAPGHCWQITASAGSSIGIKGMLLASRVMALFGLKVLTDPKIYEKAKAEFDKAMAGKKYKCPITPELLVP